MDRNLRVTILTHHRGSLLANGLVAQRRALVVHADYPDVFRHQLSRSPGRPQYCDRYSLSGSPNWDESPG